MGRGGDNTISAGGGIAIERASNQAWQQFGMAVFADVVVVVDDDDDHVHLVTGAVNMADVESLVELLQSSRVNDHWYLAKVLPQLLGVGKFADLTRNSWYATAVNSLQEDSVKCECFKRGLSVCYCHRLIGRL